MALSKPTFHTLRTLAVGRILVGAGTLILPSHSSFIFGLTPAAIPLQTDGINVMGRLFGVRDATLGVFLWRSLSTFNSRAPAVAGREARDGKGMETDRLIGNSAAEVEDAVARSQLTTALYLGMICDAVDVLSSILCIFEGSMTGRAIVFVGVGAFTFACMGFAGLRALKAL